MYEFRGMALSVQQPWASAIVFAGKDVENRIWRTHFRGPVAIHATATADDELLEHRCRMVRGGELRTLHDWIRRGRSLYGMPKDDDLNIETPVSCIIGIAMLVDCRESFPSPWWGGSPEYAFVLRGVVPIAPIPMAGKLKLWRCRFKYRPLERSKSWKVRSLPAER